MCLKAVPDELKVFLDMVLECLEDKMFGKFSRPQSMDTHSSVDNRRGGSCGRIRLVFLKRVELG